MLQPLNLTVNQISFAGHNILFHVKGTMVRQTDASDGELAQSECVSAQSNQTYCTIVFR